MCVYSHETKTQNTHEHRALANKCTFSVSTFRFICTLELSLCCYNLNNWGQRALPPDADKPGPCVAEETRAICGFYMKIYIWTRFMGSEWSSGDTCCNAEKSWLWLLWKNWLNGVNKEEELQCQQMETAVETWIRNYNYLSAVLSGPTILRCLYFTWLFPR